MSKYYAELIILFLIVTINVVIYLKIKNKFKNIKKIEEQLRKKSIHFKVLNEMIRITGHRDFRVTLSIEDFEEFTGKKFIKNEYCNDKHKFYGPGKWSYINCSRENRFKIEPM
jgi:hypothetical protein